jgi:hypothetical protein
MFHLNIFAGAVLLPCLVSGEQLSSFEVSDMQSKRFFLHRFSILCQIPNVTGHVALLTNGTAYTSSVQTGSTQAQLTIACSIVCAQQVRIKK